jgi:hypothetical protein
LLVEDAILREQWAWRERACRLCKIDADICLSVWIWNDDVVAKIRKSNEMIAALLFIVFKVMMSQCYDIYGLFDY